jgi:hypothetical protein
MTDIARTGWRIVYEFCRQVRLAVPHAHPIRTTAKIMAADLWHFGTARYDASTTAFRSAAGHELHAIRKRLHRRT